MEEIRKYLRVDSFAYLSLEGLTGAVGGKKDKFCMACFDGDYPLDLDIDNQEDKERFENKKC
jgi:amidophosphoribosyltransferase